MDRTLQLIGAISILLPGIAILIGNFKYKKKPNLNFLLFGIYYLFAFFTQLLLIVMALFGLHNIIMIKIYLIFELPLLGIFLLSLFMGKKAINVYTVLLFSIIPIISLLVFHEQNMTPFEAVVINCLVLSVLSILTIRKVNLLNSNLKNEWYYYIILAIVIYSANNSIVYSFTSLGSTFAYSLHAIFNTTHNILFSVGAWVFYKSST